MKNSVLAARYARAIYNLVKDSSGSPEEQDKAYAQLKLINETFRSDNDVAEFLFSPVIRPAQKVEVLQNLVQSLQISDALKNFLLVLGKKNRLGIFPEILAEYQTIADEAHGVTRGTVRSASVLAPEERKRIETLVGKATKKQVILTYKEDPSLLGGLVAEVGSFTFDDSLISHLKRINEQLTRSTH